MKILAEVTIDETGIIEQMDKVKEIIGKSENEMLKLYGMLAEGKASAVVKGESAEEKILREN